MGKALVGISILALYFIAAAIRARTTITARTTRTITTVSDDEDFGGGGKQAPF